MNKYLWGKPVVKGEDFFSVDLLSSTYLNISSAEDYDRWSTGYANDGPIDSINYGDHPCPELLWGNVDRRLEPWQVAAKLEYYRQQQIDKLRRLKR